MSAITKAVILDYQASMNQYLDYVTTNGYCQRVKTIVQFGIDNGKIKINPFSGIKLRKGEKNVQFLSEEEVDRIRTTDFQVTEDGQYYIHDKRNKTGVFYTAVILEQGVEILKKYHFKLPIIGNHKLNVYLKAIRDLCGIDKPIFSHVARHTYVAASFIGPGISTAAGTGHHRHYNCSQIGHMKTRAIILSFFLLLPLVPAMAQKKDKHREVIVCGTCGRVINSKASFDGGDANKFSVWVNEHKRYPEEAKKAGIEGRVTTQFTITKEGKLTNVRILRGLHPLLDEEAVRVIESAPQLWEPAWDKKGEPTDVTYTFPVIFKLTEEVHVDYPIRGTVQY